MDNELIEQLEVISEEFEINLRPIPKTVIDETIKYLKATNGSKSLNELLKKMESIKKKAPACEFKGSCQDNPCIYELAVQVIKGLRDLYAKLSGGYSRPFWRSTT